MSCGKYWDLDRPIRVEVLSNRLSHVAIDGYFNYAIHQLGGTVTCNADQVVYVTYNEEADCYGCTELTIEHVGWKSDTIQILPRIMSAPANALEHSILHGLGHVLGADKHLSQTQSGLMLPMYDLAPKNKSWYTLEDLRLIDTGRVSGGVFDNIY